MTEWERDVEWQVCDRLGKLMTGTVNCSFMTARRQPYDRARLNDSLRNRKLENDA